LPMRTCPLRRWRLFPFALRDTEETMFTRGTTKYISRISRRKCVCDSKIMKLSKYFLAEPVRLTGIFNLSKLRPLLAAAFQVNISISGSP